MIVGGYWNGEVGEMMRRELRFGPDPEWRHEQEIARTLRAGNELGRIIREAMDQMRKGLWFWEV